MQNFQNIVHNPKSLENPVIYMSALQVMPNAAFISLNQPNNQTKIQPWAQPGRSQARVITLQKTVKYCTYYNRDYYTRDKYHDKYP